MLEQNRRRQAINEDFQKKIDEARKRREMEQKVREYQLTEQPLHIKQESSKQDILITGDDAKKMNDIYQLLLSGDKSYDDAILFAYFLYKNNFVKYELIEGNRFNVLQRVNFCNNTKCYESKFGKKSKLETMYTSQLFDGDYEQILSYKGCNDIENIVCNQCSFYGTTNPRLCPYLLLKTIDNLAKDFGKTTDEVFDTLLSIHKIPFRGIDVNGLKNPISKNGLDKFNTKSVYAAYMMLANKLINIEKVTDKTVSYTYLPLCRTDKKDSVINEMVNFWKTNNGVYDTITIDNFIKTIDIKSSCYKTCSFEQCPHKIAAYLTYIAQKFNEDAVDLAYYLSKNTTTLNLPLRNDFQLNRYIEGLNQSPFTKQSKEAILDIIRFIISKNKNNSIPFLPFGIAISTPDKNKAIDVIEDSLLNAIWYFEYLGNQTPTQRFSFITNGIDEIYEYLQNLNENTILILEDIAIPDDEHEKNDFVKICNKLAKIMDAKKNFHIPILIGTNKEIQDFFNLIPEFKQNVFNKHLEMKNMNDDLVFSKLIDELSKSFTIPPEVEEELKKYIISEYVTSSLQSTLFINDTYEKIVFKHYKDDIYAPPELKVEDIPRTEQPRSEEEIFADINSMPGLQSVKQELEKINTLVKLNTKLGKNSKNAVSLHTVFTGNPGTGKTTVARCMAEMLYSMGFIREKKCISCSAKDLIGEYTGQTAPKTAAKCEQAYNGILFIDEAYQLNPYTSVSGGKYEEECIAELITQMEDNKDKLVVILAGYTDEIDALLKNANPGLQSRIQRRIEFPDYTVDELLHIFRNLVDDNGYILDDNMVDELIDIFEKEKRINKRFGNARFVRNLFENTIMNHAYNTVDIPAGNPELQILTLKDLKR